MQKTTIFSPLIGLGLIFLTSCGGALNAPPPDITGVYTLTTTQCAGSLSNQIKIEQDGYNFSATPVPLTSMKPWSGTVGSNGALFISIPTTGTDRIVCDGNHHDNLMDLDCDLNGGKTPEIPCKVQYQKNN